ncbi:hypothetical protein Bca4012_026423 [Brassica carinata]
MHGVPCPWNIFTVGCLDSIDAGFDDHGDLVTEFQRSCFDLLVVVSLDPMLVVLDSEQGLISAFFELVYGVEEHVFVDLDVLRIMERRRLATFTSAVAMASTLYARENGVVLVAPRGVVRWLQRTPSSSSVQWPFFRSRRFLMPPIISLLDDSACPLPCKYLGVEGLKRMFHLLQNSLKLPDMNCEPLSVTISYGRP